MPISTVIYLIPPEDVTLRPTMGHHAHAVLLSLLRIGNPKKSGGSSRGITAETVHRFAIDWQRGNDVGISCASALERSAGFGTHSSTTHFSPISVVHS